MKIKKAVIILLTLQIILFAIISCSKKYTEDVLFVDIKGEQTNRITNVNYTIVPNSPNGITFKPIKLYF